MSEVKEKKGYELALERFASLMNNPDTVRTNSERIILAILLELHDKEGLGRGI